jgi:hypothetical protein
MEILTVLAESIFGSVSYQKTIVLKSACLSLAALLRMEYPKKDHKLFGFIIYWILDDAIK